jgi:hypothetical protein
MGAKYAIRRRAVKTILAVLGMILTKPQDNEGRRRHAAIRHIWECMSKEEL